MARSQSGHIERRISKEIRRHVAAADKRMLRTAPVIAEIRCRHPGLGLADRELEDMIIAAASVSRVPIEFGRTRQERRAL